jgi:hypothetical protein
MRKSVVSPFYLLLEGEKKPLRSGALGLTKANTKKLRKGGQIHVE